MDLVSGHEREKATALGQFDATPKMGGAQLATPYRVELEAAINVSSSVDSKHSVTFDFTLKIFLPKTTC